MTIKNSQGFESDANILIGEGIVFTGTYALIASPHLDSLGAGGAQCIRMTGAGIAQIPASGSASLDEIYVAVYRDTSGGSPFTAIEFMANSGTQNCTVTIEADNLVRIRRGDTGGAVIAISGSVVTNNAWHFIKIIATILDVGQVKVYVDTVLYADTGGADCQNTATPGFVTVRLRNVSGGTITRFDDYIHGSTGSIPDEELFVYWQRPAGNGSPCQSTPSTGVDQYATVDENPVDTADYNEIDTAAQEDNLTVTPLTFVPRAILGVRPVVYATGQGTITQGCTKVQSAGVDAYGANAALSTGGTYTCLHDVFEVDPATGVAWLPAAVDAMSVGYQAS